jgi:phage terminase large subunit
MSRAAIEDKAFREGLAWRDRYANDIILWIREELHAEPWPWQIEALEQYNLRTRRVTIRSGHGVGKTTLLAWMILHHILFRFPQKTQITAPTEKQLYNALWAEVKKWWFRLPAAQHALIEVKHDRAELIERPGESFSTCATSRAETPEALAGVHCDPGFVLLIADEASGVPEQVFEAAAGSMSGNNAMTILTGNPVRGQGMFFDTHTSLAGDGTNGTWWTKKVSCLDVPEQVSADFILDMKMRYGENSNAYRVRVLGEFPVSDDDTIIPFDLVEACFGRDVSTNKTAPVIWGVDPARFGRDRSTLSKRQQNKLVEPVKWWIKLDTMELAARIHLEWDNTPQMLRPTEINIDVIGIGAGVVDRLRQLGLPARGINVSESPSFADADKYANLKAELWFKGRQWFEKRDCVLPDYYKANARRAEGDDLVAELTTPKYRFRKGSQKIEVESKDDLKKRGMDSPDLADSFMLTFASDGITLAFGRAATSWNKPIRRRLKGIV